MWIVGDNTVDRNLGNVQLTSAACLNQNSISDMTPNEVTFGDINSVFAREAKMNIFNLV